MAERPVKRILVADDEPDIAGLLTLHLELNGFSVQTVTNGIDARDAIVRTLPDLVVLDRMMPGMDGLEVLSVIKANPTTCDIPVVMLTAKASDDDVWEGWQCGADYYMTKPFDLEELSRFITYLEGESKLLV